MISDYLEVYVDDLFNCSPKRRPGRVMYDLCHDFDGNVPVGSKTKCRSGKPGISSYLSVYLVFGRNLAKTLFAVHTCNIVLSKGDAGVTQYLVLPENWVRQCIALFVKLTEIISCNYMIKC